MADIKRVSTEEAQKLLEQGYVYVDVRSEPEFAEGHVPGALNVPVMHKGSSGMSANDEFLDVVQSAFEKSERLVLGCRSGARSLKALKMMLSVGFEDIVDHQQGWAGSRDAFGRREPGWSSLELPTETGAPEGQAYADVKQRRST